MEHCELTRRLSGDLTAIEKIEYQHHLAICPACQDALREQVAMEDALVFLEAPMKPPRATWKAIRNRISPQRPRYRVISAAVAGLALGAMALAFNVYQKPTTPHPIFAADQLEARLTSTNSAVHGTAVLNLVTHHLTVHIRGLTTLPSGQVYELWSVKGHHEQALGPLQLKTNQASFSGLAEAGSGSTLVICPAEAGWTASTTLGDVVAKGSLTPS